MKNLTIGICNDHAGTELKNFLMDALKDEVKLFVNFGTDSNDSCDYPDFAHPMA
ncbi:MAG: RpiB/LacA/LacB family sugar-phosphate isomerase, partial [Paludibacteraceae bacterium]|nr:RpiB/LacA/LacB family sugar-phosphate isomerase [Paludibacteraceae bacterium]